MNNAEQKWFFQQCLYDALMQLMREKKFEKISVGDLCGRAGGLYKMLMDWMNTGTQTAPEEMTAFLAAGSKALTEM